MLVQQQLATCRPGMVQLRNMPKHSYNSLLSCSQQWQPHSAMAYFCFHSCAAGCCRCERSARQQQLEGHSTAERWRYVWGACPVGELAAAALCMQRMRDTTPAAPATVPASQQTDLQSCNQRSLRPLKHVTHSRRCRMAASVVAVSCRGRSRTLHSSLCAAPSCW
jgi:hypothetical protein